MGIHRRPSTTVRAVRGVALTGATTGGLLAIPATANAADQAAWDQVVQCESGGRNVNNASGPGGTPASSASGYFQIIDGTWRAYGGAEFGPRAIDATYEEQLVVAERILAGQGPGAWGACGRPLIGQSATERTVPAPPPPVVEEPPAPPVEEPPTDPIPAQPIPTPGNEAPTDPIPAQQTLTILVKPGDWLSTIARDKIPGLCEPETDIRTCWQPFYEQNRDVIGPNPDAIFPGMALTFVGNLALPGGPPVEVPEEAPVELPPEPQPASPDGPHLEANQDAPVDTPPAPQPAPEDVAPSSGVARPAAGALTSPYGDGRGHDGIDFDGAIGDPVRSATDGIVTRVDLDHNGGYGKLVEVTAPDGTMTRYTHLNAALVSVNQVVVAGEVIAEIGNTGSVVSRTGDGSHLHFEVHVNGGPIDPRPWLASHGISV